MKNENLQIKFAHLYPKHLNLYGDTGNVLALKKRCEWRGIDFLFNEINIGDELTSYDFYFIGGGQDAQQIEVANDIFKHKDFLTQERDMDAVFLSVCGGYQLLGHYYQPHNGERIEGISLLDAYTVAGSKRFIGNVTAKADFISPQTIVGFENHSGLTYLSGSTKPLAMVDIGYGNNGEDKTEGARFKNVFGTYFHGSFLPKNPSFADYLISLALKKRYNKEILLEKLDDEIEIATHDSLVDKAY